MKLDEEFHLYETDRATAYLKAKGAPDGMMVANADVTVFGERWKPSADGMIHALIVPVCNAFEMVDLIAFDPKAPDQWYTRTGLHSMLGIVELQRAILYGHLIVVHDTPLQWLLSGGEGCCPLTMDSCVAFQGVGEIKASDRVFEMITERLEIEYPRPKKIQ